MAYSMDGEEDWIWSGEGPGYVDVQEIRAQLSFSGSYPALREIRSAVVICYRSHVTLFRCRKVQPKFFKFVACNPC